MLRLLFVALPWLILYYAIRRGPIPNRFHKGETVLGAALAVGGIGFVLGFFGPILLAPDANQGPLLGIFYTGPGGVLLGLLWGMIRKVRRDTVPG